MRVTCENVLGAQVKYDGCWIEAPCESAVKAIVSVIGVVREVDLAKCKALVEFDGSGDPSDRRGWVPVEHLSFEGATEQQPEPWTNERLGALCREWQGAMYLADWEVVVKYVGIREMKLKHARSECQWLTPMKQAEIRILRLEDRAPDVDLRQDPEVDLVHELEHLHWAPAFDLTEPDSAERTMLEQGIQANARTMVALKREGEAK